jgi:uncharacterized membrane protein
LTSLVISLMHLLPYLNRCGGYLLIYVCNLATGLQNQAHLLQFSETRAFDVVAPDREYLFIIPLVNVACKSTALLLMTELGNVTAS